MKSNEYGTNENTVIIRRLSAAHGINGFSEFVPLSKAMSEEVHLKVKDIFDALGGKSLIKSSGDVYIKPNGVGADPYVYTRPEVVAAAIRYWLNAGARKVYVMENSSQGNYTRLVFEMIGYTKICRDTGAIPVYLDEDKTVPFAFKRESPGTSDYELSAFGMPAIVADKLIKHKDSNLYVSIPKLKTHTLSVVSLGIKNQWGFPAHKDRSPDHNYNLHGKIVDLLDYIRPDVTLIEGIEGTIHGHYPLRSMSESCVRPFKVLIGGLNVTATDIIGARVFGLGVEDVPHIKIAVQRGHGRGVESLDDIPLAGDFDDANNLDVLNELDAYGGKYPAAMHPRLPDDVTIIKGRDMACIEGCHGNSLGILQYLAFDYGGSGGWTLITGKGFDTGEIDRVKGRVLIAGRCAAEEIGDALLKRLGRRNVYMSPECNDITASMESMVHLMKVNMFRYTSRTSLNPLKAMWLLLNAKLRGSHGRQLNPACVFFKLR